MNATMSLTEHRRQLAGMALALALAAVPLPAHNPGVSWRLPPVPLGVSLLRRAWAQTRLGGGVGVAVIGPGASPMTDLRGRVVSGPDLSGEGTLIDTYGHGTVMAGIIAGSGADSVNNKNGAYTGVAPHATVVAVKVAGRNGAVDVSTVLQAMHWVSAYQSQFNIRVLNLSYGTPSTQNPAVDPLNYAVDRKSTRLNSSHSQISYAVFCLKKKKKHI